MYLVQQYGLSLSDLENVLDAQKSLTTKLQPRIVRLDSSLVIINQK